MAKSPTEPVSQLGMKAELIAEKDRAIVLAAWENFLRDGFAGSSMDAIAKTACVSVKTIYGQFSNKDELFNKVMVGACTDNLLAGDIPSVDALQQRFPGSRKQHKEGCLKRARNTLTTYSPKKNWRSTVQSPATPVAFRSLASNTTRPLRGAGRAS